jgi:hypothetical protein
VKDYKDDKFNSMEYTNEDCYYISEKTYEGRPLKVLEHLGLWNRAMYNWNTLFVEVPVSISKPVKTLNDLLKGRHQIVKEVVSK